MREQSLGARTIDDYFGPSFFRTNFWCMWSTMFAFQPWHSLAECRRYMRRFLHLLPGFNRLEGIQRTRLNQYDSLIQPLVAWLRGHGVRIHLDTVVTDVAWTGHDAQMTLQQLHCSSDGSERVLELRNQDRVLITLGSMTEGSSLGTHSSPPVLERPKDQGAWGLWRRLAAKSAHLGRPGVFTADVSQTMWESFTVTLPGPGFFRFMERFTGNPAGTGGLVTFQDSPWLMSVVLAHQPHFAGQPEQIHVFWGYGLFPGREGSRVRKTMLDCSGSELLEELSCHLPLGRAAPELFAGANCIPCLMPYITSQFMPRRRGDRPAVRPPGATNFALLGQYCELPDDVVFTVEYSIRSAWMAVDSLLKLRHAAPPVYAGIRDPRVLVPAVAALCR